VVKPAAKEAHVRASYINKLRGCVVVSDNIAGAEFLGFAIRISTFMEHYSEGYASHPSIGHNKKKVPW